MSTSPPARAVGYALTGEVLAAAPAGTAVTVIVDWLAACGWPADVLAEHRRQTIDEGRPWPHVVPGDVRVDVGAAQLQALVRGCRAALRLDHQPSTVRDAGQPPDAGTRRLLAERPPHHGSVG